VPSHTYDSLWHLFFFGRRFVTFATWGTPDLAPGTLLPALRQKAFGCHRFTGKNCRAARLYAPFIAGHPSLFLPTGGHGVLPAALAFFMAA